MSLYLLERVSAYDVTRERRDVFAGDAAGGDGARDELAGAGARLHAVRLRAAPHTWSHATWGSQSFEVALLDDHEYEHLFFKKP